MKYSYFNNKNSKQCRQVSISELLDLIGTEEIKERCAKIGAAVMAGDEKEANTLKMDLPAIVVNELYKSGAPRKKGTGDPSGLFMIDYDYCKSPEELNELKDRVMELALNHPQLKQLIAAAHVSPRLHGVHVWCRWIEGCHDVEECQAKFAELAQLPNYDNKCKDASRCSFLVHKNMFFVQNWGAMERNEEYAKLQKKLTNDGKSIKRHVARRTADVANAGNSGSTGSGSGSDTQPVEEGLKDVATMYGDIPLQDIFNELTKECAPEGMVDEDGNVGIGARDNTLFHVLALFRYCTDNIPDRMRPFLPQWALDLDEECPGTTESKLQAACERNVSASLPPTLRRVLKRLGDKDKLSKMSEEEKSDMYAKELEEIEEGQKFFFSVPKVLPPVFQEFADAFPFAWRPAAMLSLLPVLGTLMSRVRGRYLDGREHSPSFQTVIEGDFAMGKGNITDLARFCIEPLAEADAIGNEELNKYNQEVEKNNGTDKLPEKPDVCVRKITGDFTVAGFEETLTTSKGLHIWCSTSEIDELRRTWAAVSHILRKAYDNDFYGRSLQSTKSFRGERRIFFNTLLCGTPKRINTVFSDPEDGLVSRTMFFRLLKDDGQMPVVKMPTKTKSKLAVLLHNLHDHYSLGQDGVPVQPKVFQLEYVNKALRKWLDEKYKDSLLTGNFAEDAFRRRDAVNGFRAGMIAHVVFAEKFGKVTEAQKKIVVEFAKWVAEYSLRTHLAKFGKGLKRGSTEGYTTKKNEEILSKLPERFSIVEAYETFSHMPHETVRSNLTKLCQNGYLVREERGMYSKCKV